jgi:hypothetical protein
MSYSTSAVMDAPAKIPLSERVNLRMIGFAAVILFLLGWPLYTFVSEYVTGGIHDRGSYKEVDLKALGFFEIDPATATTNDIPPRYRALDGQKVKLSGEVFSPYEAGGRIGGFTLVYSIAKCCFGGPPKVQERVFATVKNGKTVKFAGDGYHDVIGTLHVTMKRDEKGGLTEVYHLDVDQMEPRS